MEIRMDGRQWMYAVSAPTAWNIGGRLFALGRAGKPGPVPQGRARQWAAGGSNPVTPPHT